MCVPVQCAVTWPDLGSRILDSDLDLLAAANWDGRDPATLHSSGPEERRRRATFNLEKFRKERKPN